jgi:hypothetical protein
MRRVRATLTLALLQAAHCFAPRRSLHQPHSPATKGCTRRRRRLSATNEDVLDAIKALSSRIDSLAADVELLKKSRVDGLEAELRWLKSTSTAEALRTPPATTSARTVPGLNAALSARAALGAVRGQQPATSPALRRAATTYDADEVEELGGEAFFFEGGGGKNDEFLDDEMEELLAIGGDPTFLEQARGGSGEFEWDGVEDDAAHFDDPAD